MLLAADVGGTKSLLGIYHLPALRGRRRTAEGWASDGRPRPQVMREFATLDFDSLEDLITTFVEETALTVIEAMCVGVAGPVTELTARLTNVPWIADATFAADRFGCPVRLVNDLEAMATAVPVLDRDELAVLQEGIALPSGNAAVIAAGTGLGEALLHNVDGRFVASPTEAGHADFAARTPREMELVFELTRIHGRVENERVISGPGLVNLFRFTHGAAGGTASCHAIPPGIEATEMPAAISRSALEGRCERCGEALELFVEAYGAEAGNLALRSIATAGVYVGGGIAPKILPALQSGLFIDAFCDKSPLADLLRTIPVAVILNPATGLLGAAVCAERMLESN
jgi:glucokinase